MIRYWTYLSLLVPIGALLPTLAYLEPGGLFSLQGVLSGSGSYNGLLAFLLSHTAPIGALFGIAVALWATFWDRVKHGAHNPSGAGTGKRLLLNLCWCNLYSVPLLLLNIALMREFRGSLPLNSAFEYALLIYGPMVVVGILNTSAVFWAIFRTINTTGVLTPRAFWRELRHSTRLENR